MGQFINGKEIRSVCYFEKCGQSMCKVLYLDHTSEVMSSGDFNRSVKRIADKNEKTRFDTEKSEGYEKALKEGYVGLQATSKQRGLGRWK